MDRSITPHQQYSREVSALYYALKWILSSTSNSDSGKDYNLFTDTYCVKLFANNSL